MIWQSRKFSIWIKSIWRTIFENSPKNYKRISFTSLFHSSITIRKKQQTNKWNMTYLNRNIWNLESSDWRKTNSSLIQERIPQTIRKKMTIDLMRTWKWNQRISFTWDDPNSFTSQSPQKHNIASNDQLHQLPFIVILTYCRLFHA